MAMIDMKTMRYINLLDKITHVKTTKCFAYNNNIIFAVPSVFMSKAIGANAGNIRILQEKIGKRVRIVAEPNGIQDAEKFLRDIVAPVKFKTFEIREGIVVINAGTATKASLIGRNRKRIEELSQIAKDNFGMEVRIV